MAMKISTENKADRQDTFHIVPSDIKKGRNARMIPSANYKQNVIDRAVSIAEKGQIQPAEAYRNEDNTLTLSLGFTRYDAVDLLRAGFEEAGKFYHDPDAKLWVKVIDSDSDSAFIRGIIENLERDDTTDLQEALAQSELRTTQGMTDTQIAKLYGATNTNRVAALQKLISLPDNVQQLVHTGKLALYSALDTLKLSEDERTAVIDGSTNPKGRVEGQVLRKLIRDLTEGKAGDGEEAGFEDDEPEEGEPKAPSLKRTVKEFRTFVSAVTAEGDEGEGYADRVNDLLFGLVEWFNGTKNFGDKKIKTLLEAL